MIQVEVGRYEKREIDSQILRVLRDLGNPPPPLNLDDVLKLLKIDLQYYGSTDPSVIKELTHRFTLLARKTIPDIAHHLANALAKSKLNAFWIPKSQRILLDDSVPQPKHRWIQSHEIVHSLTGWHKDFLLGDNSLTLDPTCHATIEAEANYGAGRLLFLADMFDTEAKEFRPIFESIKALSKKYQNSLVSTMWRLIEAQDLSRDVFGMISAHPHFPEVGAHDGPDAWRYFVPSPGFRIRYANIRAETIYRMIQEHCSYRKRGPLFSVAHPLSDANGQTREFEVECFSTTYAVLTLGIART